MELNIPWYSGQVRNLYILKNSLLTLLTAILFLVSLLQVAHYVWNKKEFDAVDPETTDYLMGKILSVCFSILLCRIRHLFSSEGTASPSTLFTVYSTFQTQVQPKLLYKVRIWIKRQCKIKDNTWNDNRKYKDREIKMIITICK